MTLGYRGENRAWPTPTTQQPRPARPKNAPKSGRKSAPKSASKRKPAAGRDQGGRFPLRRLVYWGVVLGLWGLIMAGGAVALVASTLPPIQSLAIPKRPPSIEIDGIDGKPLAVRGEMGGAAVSLKDLPPYLPRAFIAIEDRRFYHHYGVDPLGLARALIADVLHRGVQQGGSTITQQLAKNLFLTQQRTLWRKMQEVVLALWIERKFSKNEILELYLNRVYFGSGAYGVEAAAQRYFGKPAREVKLAEAAMLAGLVKSPTRLAPSRNPDGAERRAQIVLAAMAEDDFITETMAKTAMAQPAHAVKPSGAGTVGYVADWIMDVLDDLVGHVDDDLKVETTIDPALQAAAEKALVDELAQKGQKFDVEQGALVAMTPRGRGARHGGRQELRRKPVQPRGGGQAPAGLGLQAVRVSDRARARAHARHGARGQADRAQGLEAGELRPPISRTGDADAGAVAVAQHRVGAPDARVRAGRGRQDGLSARHRLQARSQSFARARHLGGLADRAGRAPMRPSPMAAPRSRRTWSNGCAPWPARRSTPAQAPNFGRIIEARYVGMMNAMMHETLTSGTAHSAQLAGWPAAGKTGTSQDFRDAWFIGYTGHLVTGVWLGNDDSSPTRKATGGGMPVEIWSHFMKPAHQGVPVAGLPEVDTAASRSPRCWPPAALRSRRRRSGYRRADRRAATAAPASTTGCSSGCSAGVRPTVRHGSRERDVDPADPSRCA